MKIQFKLSTFIKITCVVFVVFNVIYLSSSYIFYSLDDIEIFSPGGTEHININHDSQEPEMQFVDEEDDEQDNGNANYMDRINGLLKKVSENKNDYWLSDTTLKDTEVTIDPNHFLNDSTQPEAWRNKNTLFFDPRVTFSLYVDYLRRQFNGSSDTLVEVPFHWADWLDLTDLNSELVLPVEKRRNCEYVKRFSEVKGDPEYRDLHCIDVMDFSPRMLARSGFDRIEQIPSVIVTNYPDYRAFHDVRLLEAKSYSMTFLPNPFKIIFLNGEGGTYEARVEKSEVKRRIVKSGMMNDYLAANYAEKGGASSLKKIINSMKAKEITLDPVEEFRKLKKETTPKFLSKEDDLYDILESKGNNKPIYIPDDAFRYSRDDLFDAMEAYQRTAKERGLNTEQKTFLRSIELSAELNTFKEYPYFRMATLEIARDKKNTARDAGWHYDWRFFNGGLQYESDNWTRDELEERTNIILDRLIRNWFRFAAEKGVVSWIQHGPLLSWYWNGMMFPFDNDIDIQMPIRELLHLGEQYNQTLVVEDIEEGFGKFMIDVGTFVHTRVISRKENHIDARFIDVDTGIYIDITGLSQSASRPPIKYRSSNIISAPYDKSNMINDRRIHFYTFDQISPLKKSMISGVPVFIPHQISARLNFEYPMGMISEEYADWYFVPKLRLWIDQKYLLPIFDEEDYRLSAESPKIVNKDKMKDLVSKMSDEKLFQLLRENEEILCEFFLTKDITAEHLKENQFLFNRTETDGKVTIVDNDKLESDPSLQKEYDSFASKTIKMHRPLRKSLFQYLNIDKPSHRRERLAQTTST